MREEDVTTILDDNAILTVDEATVYLKMTAPTAWQTLERYARRGWIKGGKVGKSWRFRKKDLDAFVFCRDRR